MIYEWDEIKASLNAAKHGVTFEEAKSVFCDENSLLLYDDEHSSDEDRFLLLGYSVYERMLLVVHCYKSDDAIRIISARKATKNEQKTYKERKNQ